MKINSTNPPTIKKIKTHGKKSFQLQERNKSILFNLAKKILQFMQNSNFIPQIKAIVQTKIIQDVVLPIIENQSEW